MPSAKELAKALAYRGEIRNTPQNSFLGAIANFLAPVSEFADRDKLPGSIPLLGGMSFADLSGLKGSQSLIEDMSYGKSPVRGATLNTAKVDPRLLDLAAVSGAMMPVGKALGKAALREGAKQIHTGTGVLGSKVIDPRQRMFAGEGAKTADHGALKVAKDMKAAGVPDEAIHAKTKWTFAFADGKPRFEIDDSAAKFNMNSDIQNKIDANRLRIAEIKDIKRDSLAAEKTQPDLFPKDLSRARASLQGEANNLQTDISGNFGLDYPGGQSAGFRYEHPGLYDAYPEIKERVVVSTGGGKGGDLLGQQYQDRIDINHPAMYEFKTNPKTGYTDYAETPMKAKSTATHEFQHRIQDAEGFARGGSPEMFEQSEGFNFKQLQDAAILDKTMRASNFNQLEALNRFKELFGRKPEPGAFAALERIGSGKELDIARDAAKLTVNPYDSYRRLAGEAEARLTQARMNMTAAERAASYPPSMFDVPVKDQIVRYGDNVGGAMMHRPKLQVKPPKEDIYSVADANFSMGIPSGNKTVKIGTLQGSMSSAAGDAERVKKLAGQMSADGGYIERLIVDQNGNVIEGQHRLNALRSLGVTDIPVSVIQDASPTYDLLMKSGKLRSEHARQIVRDSADMLKSEGGDVSAVLSGYDLPKGYEQYFMDAVNDLSKPKAKGMSVPDNVGGAMMQRPNKPSWYDNPSENPFAKGMTQGQLHDDWIARHKIPVNKEGFIDFYHASPSKLENIKAGSYLETDANKAKFYAARDRGLNPEDMKLHKVTLPKYDFEIGGFPTLRNDYKVKTEALRQQDRK